MKLTKYLLDFYYIPTFFCIIGFTVGSVFVLMPNFSSNIEILLSLVCCFFGFYVSGLLKNMSL